VLPVGQFRPFRFPRPCPALVRLRPSSSRGLGAAQEEGFKLKARPRARVARVLSNVAALVAALAAMLTAGGTFLTVGQMQRQMEASCRPELTFARVLIKAEPERPTGALPVSSGPLPTHWTEQPLPTHWTEEPRFPVSGTTTSTSKITAPAWFFTNLYNVGLGAATSINVVWNFAVEDMIEEINRLAQRTLTPAFYEYNKGALSLESQTWPKTTILWENEKKASLDYIMPESTHHTAAALRIPLTYIQLFSTYLYLQILQKDNRAETKIFPLQIDTFPLQIDISYGDISGRRHQVSFSLRISLISIVSASKRKDSSMTFDAYIDAEKVP